MTTQKVEIGSRIRSQNRKKQDMIGTRDFSNDFMLKQGKNHVSSPYKEYKYHIIS